MAYFPNGADSDAFMAAWCDRCALHAGPHGCPVLAVHIAFNSSQCGNAGQRSVLAALIAGDWWRADKYGPDSPCIGWRPVTTAAAEADRAFRADIERWLASRTP